MTPPDRMRALLKEPGLVVMPAVWDGLSARLAAEAYADDLALGRGEGRLRLPARTQHRARRSSSVSARSTASRASTASRR